MRLNNILSGLKYMKKRNYQCFVVKNINKVSKMIKKVYYCEMCV